jgi:hypothetical protein
LHVSGRLDPALGGSLLTVKNRDYFFDHTSKDKTSYDSTRRSIYLPVVRNHLYDGFDLFDYNDAGVSTGDRATTTVAPQALFLLNSDLVVNSAGGLAERLIRHSADDRARLSVLFETCLCRPATERELAASLRFLNEARGMLRDASPASSERRVWQAVGQTLLMSNEFIYID